MKTLAIASTIGGLVLALSGLVAMSASSADFSHLVQAAPLDRTPWAMLAGVALFVTGVATSFRAFRKGSD